MSVTLTGGPFSDPHGTAVASGKLRLKLNKEGRRSGGQVCPAYQIDIPLDSSGNIQTNTTVYGNDELTPTDTYYTATVFDSNNSPVYGPVMWVLSGGGTVNVNTINPSSGTVSAGVSVNFSADQILFDRANQDILLERDSANVLRLGTGDSFIPQTDAGELGSATKRWLTRLISSVFYGSSSGSTTLQPSATASGTLTLPAATDTLVGKATTDTLTNKTLTSPTITNKTSTGTDAGAETLQNKTLTGAAAGNNVERLYLVSQQASQTGTGAALGITNFTYTIPANTVSATSSVEIYWMVTHGTGSASIAYTLDIGDSSANSLIATAATAVSGTIVITKGTNANANLYLATITSVPIGANANVAAYSTTATVVSQSCTITIKFNVAGTDAINGQQMRVRQSQ